MLSQKLYLFQPPLPPPHFGVTKQPLNYMIPTISYSAILPDQLADCRTHIPMISIRFIGSITSSFIFGLHPTLSS
jgi:hypothetical protein